MSRHTYERADPRPDCAVRSCMLTVVRPRFFCREHWSMLPDSYQHAIGAAVLSGNTREVSRWVALGETCVRKLLKLMKPELTQ